MVDWLAVDGEARGAVGHGALSLGSTHERAQVCFGAFAELAGVALGDVERNNVVAWFQESAGAAVVHDAGALVAQDARKDALGVFARPRVVVSVANACIS